MEQHGRDARDFDDADYDEYGPDLSDRKPSGSGSHRKGGGGHGQAKVALPRGSACTVCRKRKLKCGGERPSCNTCLRLSHDCSYGDPVHSRLIERTEELEDKIRLLESELEAHRSMAAATPAPQHHLPPIFPTYNTSHPGPHPSSAFPHLQTHHPDSAPPLHSHVAPHFVYGQSASGSRGVPDHLASPLPDQPSPYSASHHAYNSPQDSDAYPLPSPHHPSQPPQQFQPTFSYATSNTHNVSDLIHPTPTGFRTDQHPHPPSAHLQRPGPPLPHLRTAGHAHPSPTSAYSPSPVQHRDAESARRGDSPPSAHSYSASQLQRPRLEVGWQGVDEQQSRDGAGAMATSWSEDLPSMEIILELTSIFFLTTHTHLPFINQPRFLYALRNPSTLSRTPSVCFLFALLAISAPYHSNPAVRSRAVWWYERARERVQVAINSGVSDRSHGKVNLTIETIQALALLTMIEMGKSDHQRAFLSLGQAVRIAAMLGLHRMDEDRIAERTGVPSERRLRPPALHPLPTEPILLEECRRTMCALFCLDRFEAGAVGWPIALSESDIRILLPCADFLYEDGTCNSHANPLWWPIAPDSIENEPERQGPISSFAWLCRVLWLGGRICFESYRPAGSPFAGPFASENACSQMDDVTKVLQMDHALDAVRHQLNSLATVRPGKSVVNGPILMCLIVLNCLYVNLHHLRVATGLGLSTLPFNPNAPIVPGSPEYSMQRCLEGIHSTYEIVCQLSSFENMRTSTHLSRVTTFTSFVPYVLYCVAFPAKFCIGDWQLLANDRSRSEGITGRVQRGTSSQDALPSGDDVFGPGLDQDRLALIDALCNAMDRIGVVWDVGVKFAAMVRGDRYKLQERAITRQESYHSPHDDPNSPSQHSHHSQHSHGSYGP